MEDKTFELLTKMYGEFSGKFDNIEKEMTDFRNDITQRVSSLENVVTRMEHDHGTKLDALFDGYKQVNDRLDRIETEVSKHEEVILKRVR